MEDAPSVGSPLHDSQCGEVIHLAADELPPLIGVDSVAKRYSVSPNTAYSWSARGQLGRPDLVVSGRALWYAGRFPEQGDPKRLDLIDQGPRPLYPVVLAGPKELAERFGVKPRTIETWRRRARDARLSVDDPRRTPDPILTVSLTPVWVAADWQPYAVARRRYYTVPTRTEWQREQRRAIKEWMEPAA